MEQRYTIKKSGFLTYDLIDWETNKWYGPFVCMLSEIKEVVAKMEKSNNPNEILEDFKNKKLWRG